MKNSANSGSRLVASYRERYTQVLKPLEELLLEHIRQYFRGQPRIDRISVRAKEIDSFIEKSKNTENGKLKYVDPLDQIQDQIGARVITFYRSDVEALDAIVQRYFTAIELKDRIPDSEWEFSYFGRHYVLVLPSDVIMDEFDKSMVPHFFELQIKTLFQHAWSEAGHDLGYKPGQQPLTADQKRLLAFSSAQAWGADHVFEQLFQERHAPAKRLLTPPIISPK